MARLGDAEGPPSSIRWLPYALVGAGLLGGLWILQFEPLPWPVVNTVVGWSSLAVAFGSVYYLIARGSGPGGRRPDF